MKKVLLFGNSGHAKVVRSSAESSGMEVIGYLDRTKIEETDLIYMGNELAISFDTLRNHSFFVAIGSNEIRKKLHAFCDQNSLEICQVIDQTAIIAKDVMIERGTLVAPGSIINACSRISEGVIINSGAIIEHDCNLGAFSHVAPGAILLGCVTIGQECFIGAGAVLKEGITLTSDVTIGAGTVVLHSIHESGTWVGNPAKKIR